MTISYFPQPFSICLKVKLPFCVIQVPLKLEKFCQNLKILSASKTKIFLYFRFWNTWRIRRFGTALPSWRTRNASVDSCVRSPPRPSRLWTSRPSSGTSSQMIRYQSFINFIGFKLLKFD